MVNLQLFYPTFTPIDGLVAASNQRQRRRHRRTVIHLVVELEEVSVRTNKAIARKATATGKATVTVFERGDNVDYILHLDPNSIDETTESSGVSFHAFPSFSRRTRNLLYKVIA